MRFLYILVEAFENLERYFMGKFFWKIIIAIVMLIMGITIAIMVKGNDKKYIHFSVDDTIELFKDITNNEYSSVFEQPTLALLKQIHDEYGVKVSLYVYYGDDVEDESAFCLERVPDKYREEFDANSDWIRFGFHASDCMSHERLDSDEYTTYFKKTYEELTRICYVLK